MGFGGKVKSKRTLISGILCIVFLAAGAAAWWWSIPGSDYGAYVPIACMAQIADGESCIQKEISDAEKSALMRGRSFDEAGYFKITGTSKDFEVIQDVFEVSQKESGKFDAVALARARAEAAKCGKPQALLAVLPEFSGRWSAIYRAPGGRRLLLTRYDFFGTGGRLARFEYMLRSAVNENPASVVQIKERFGGKKLWLIKWASKGVSFELYVEPSDGGGQVSFAEALDLASTVDTNCHWWREKSAPMKFAPPTEKELSAIR